MTHTHAVDREIGPRGCKGGVSYEQRCSCGCVRTMCTCAQCYDDWGTHTGDWSMPICSACGYHHPQDESCTNKNQQPEYQQGGESMSLGEQLGAEGFELVDNPGMAWDLVAQRRIIGFYHRDGYYYALLGDVALRRIYEATGRWVIYEGNERRVLVPGG